MSNHVSSEVYKRQIGSMARKAVMVLFADKASDNGTGIWAAKQTMADELDTTKQTVITTIKGLMSDGLVIEVGHRKCQNGYLVEYAIDMRALRALPLVKSHQMHRDDRSKGLTGQAALPVKPFDLTGQAALPDRSSCLTQTPLEPSLNQKPPNPLGRGSERVPIPDDWILPSVDDLPSAIGQLAAQWPSGAYQAEGEAFRQHWQGRGTKRRDWAAAWAARVQSRHEAVMRAAKAGVTFISPLGEAGGVESSARAGKRASAARRLENDRSAALHQAIKEIADQGVWSAWFEVSALVFDDCGLTVVAPSEFHRAQIEGNHAAMIERALSALGWGVDWIRVTVAGGRAAKIEKSGGLRRG